MKIFYVYTALTTMGGADRVISEKANWFANRGHDVYIVTDSQMGRLPAFPLSPKVKLIDFAIDFSKEYGHVFIIRAFIFFKLMIKYRRKLSVLIHQEKPDFIMTTLGREISFLPNIKEKSICIGEVHTTKQHIRNFHLLEQKSILFKVLTRYFRWSMNKDVGKLNALVLLAEEHRSDWQGRVPTYVIPNSIPFYPKQSSSCTNKQAIMVGRYNDAKGYDYMIPAWEIVHKQHPDWILNVYGSGELHDSVVNLIRKKHLENTIVLHDPTNDILNKYLDSSICVMSSRYEGFPMVLLESMACGVPCVSFDCPHGPKNIIKHKEDGLLIDYLNYKALADGICLLIENEKMRQAMGINARKNILRFSQESVMKQWESLLNELKPYTS